MHNEINQVIRYSPIIKYIIEHKPQKILEIWSWSQGIWRFLDIDFDWLDLTSSDYGIDENETYKGMNFIKWSALNIPLKDNLYDFVYSCDMLEHIPPQLREKAVCEAIRVCKKWWYVVFCFPCWLIAKTFDYILFIFFKFISYFSEKHIPWRLEEHMEIGYPSKSWVNKIVERLKKDWLHCNDYSANNIFWRSIIMIIDMAKCLKLQNIIINAYVKKPRLSKSFLPYRKYLIIQK